MLSRHSGSWTGAHPGKDSKNKYEAAAGSYCYSVSNYCYHYHWLHGWRVFDDKIYGPWGIRPALWSYHPILISKVPRVKNQSLQVSKLPRPRGNVTANASHNRFLTIRYHLLCLESLVPLFRFSSESSLTSAALPGFGFSELTSLASITLSLPSSSRSSHKGK